MTPPLIRSALSAALGFAAFAASPALAQQPAPAPAPPANEKVSQAIVYGEDKCPAATGDEIIVCARLPEGERYRVPQLFRGGDLLDPKNQAWANKITALERVGRFGTDSCSPAGLGGFTGCAQQLISSAYAERRATDKTDWEALVAEERRKRIEGIDAAAAEVEAAVVADEKARAERARRDAEIEARGGAPDSGAKPEGAAMSHGAGMTDGAATPKDASMRDCAATPECAAMHKADPKAAAAKKPKRAAKPKAAKKPKRAAKPRAGT